jgi:hypothetical protein
MAFAFNVICWIEAVYGIIFKKNTGPLGEIERRCSEAEIAAAFGERWP